MLRFVIVLAMIVGAGGGCWAQSSKDLAEKYQSVSGYEVRPGILMVAEFDAQGQVCQVTLTKNSQAFDGHAASTEFTNELADNVADELSPVAERGAKSEWLNPDSWIAGGVYFDKQDYENISVERAGAMGGELQSFRIIWLKRHCAGAVSRAK
jgi:hypothetical protein